jgi:N4-gp56 family major capsid protein
MTTFQFGNSGTTSAAVDTSILEVWAKLVLRDMKRAGFWGRFVGAEASGAAIIQKGDLLNNPGDTVHIEITGALTGAGVTDETVLVGSEEGLSTSEMVTIPTYYRHGVLSKRRAQKKSILDLRGEARLRLAEWGEQKLDALRFSQFTLTQASKLHTQDTSNYVANSTGVNAHDLTTLVAADTITTASLQTAALKLYNNNAKPLRMDGDDIFVAVVHPNALYDLKRESEYRDWVREAHVRGADNPFFRGATAMVDGILIFQHSGVPTVNSTSGTPVKSAKNLLFGAEAFIEGLDENPSWDEEVRDYGAEFGVAYGFAIEPRRALAKNSMIFYSAAADKP